MVTEYDLCLSGVEILVVDDDPVSLRTVATILSKFGASVLTAESGRQAIGILATQHVPILVTDIAMPEMDGLTLAREVQQMDPAIRVIATSAFTETEYLVDAIRLGFADYLVKPVKAEELVWTVRKIHDSFETLRRAREEEKRFRDVVNFLADPLMLIDDSFRIILQNRAMERVFGSRAGDFCCQVMGCNAPCDDCPAVRARATGTTQTICFTLTSGGKSRHIEATSTVLTNLAGRVTGTVEILRDVTERKDFEDVLSNIARGGSARIGQSFFSSLASWLIVTTNMDLAMVAELDDAGERFVTHAVCTREGGVPNFEFERLHTPCADAIEATRLLLNGTLLDHFPGCAPAGIPMKSYCGIGLMDSKGTQLAYSVPSVRKRSKGKSGFSISSPSSAHGRRSSWNGSGGTSHRRHGTPRSVDRACKPPSFPGTAETRAGRRPSARHPGCPGHGRSGQLQGGQRSFWSCRR